MRAPRSRDRLDALRSELESIVFANVFGVKAFAEIVREISQELAVLREERNISLLVPRSESR
jgi:hypothetical protein